MEKEKEKAAMRTTPMSLRLGQKGTQIPRLGLQDTQTPRLGLQDTRTPRLGLKDTQTLRGGVILPEDARDTEFHVRCDTPSRPYVVASAPRYADGVGWTKEI